MNVDHENTQLAIASTTTQRLIAYQALSLKAHQCAVEIALRDSHHPDLSERLIEAHRTLQMSREYLHGLYPRGHRAADEISDAMTALEAAIEAL